MKFNNSDEFKKDQLLEKTEVLRQLGLPLSQARVYTAMTKFTQLSAQAISKATQIDRSNIYRIIKSLQSLGLVKRRLITTGDLFAAIPMKEGIQLLLSRKEREYSEIQSQAKRIIDEIGEDRKRYLQEDNDRFDLIPKGETNLKAFVKSMKCTSSSIDDVIPWEGFALLFNGEEHYRALKRGVKTRFITNFPRRYEKNNNFTEVFKEMRELEKTGSFEVRSISSPPSCVFAVFDKVKTCICTLPVPNPLETPALWSNNPTLANLTQTFFDLLWLNSKNMPGLARKNRKS